MERDQVAADGMMVGASRVEERTLIDTV